MDTQIQQTIQKQVADMAPYMREAIMSVDLSRELRAVGRKYGLIPKELGELQTEVVLLVTNLAEPIELARMLIKNINLDQQKAKLIMQDVHNLILKPIKLKVNEYLIKEMGKEERKRFLHDADLARDEDKERKFLKNFKDYMIEGDTEEERKNLRASIRHGEGQKRKFFKEVKEYLERERK